MRTVIEYSEFTKKAEKVFGKDGIESIVSFLAANPQAGKKLEHFGGIRKMKWKDNSGYSIYFHPGTNNLPLAIIGIFKKGEKMVFEKILEIIIHSKIV